MFFSPFFSVFLDIARNLSSFLFEGPQMCWWLFNRDGSPLDSFPLGKIILGSFLFTFFPQTFPPVLLVGLPVLQCLHGVSRRVFFSRMFWGFLFLVFWFLVRCLLNGDTFDSPPVDVLHHLFIYEEWVQPFLPLWLFSFFLFLLSWDLKSLGSISERELPRML